MNRDEAPDSEQKETHRLARNREAVAAIRRETAAFLVQLEQEGVNQEEADRIVASAMMEVACQMSGCAPPEEMAPETYRAMYHTIETLIADIHAELSENAQGKRQK